MILTANTILTGDDKTVLNGYGILIDSEGTIQSVASLAQLKAEHPGETVIDYGEATILPGLIDMHIHLSTHDTQPDVYLYNDHLLAYLAESRAKEALSLGVTTLRDVGGRNKLCLKMVQAAEKGYIGPIPRIVHANRGICATGGHGWTGDCIQADGPDAIRQAIRLELREGADWIKLMSSHRSDVSEYTQEELNTAVDEAHRHKVKIAVHAGTQPSIGMCIEAGFDTIEHGTFMTVEQAKRMRDKGIAWVPTIIAYTFAYEYYKERRDKPPVNPTDRTSLIFFNYFEKAYRAYRDNFRALYDTGVIVCCGTDMVLYGAPTVPVARELQYMVDYGITPVQAIATATSNCAKVLGMEGQIGELRKGAEADILVVEGNAAHDIKALNRAKEVFLKGRSVHKG
jgi:imidazolonepropionase-like amidohydrolase